MQLIKGTRQPDRTSYTSQGFVNYFHQMRMD